MVSSVRSKIVTLIAAFFSMLLFASAAFAQGKYSVTVTLKDSSTDEAVSFATVSITKKGATNALKYSLTGSDGKAVLEKLADGQYTVKAEMMGYVTKSSEIKVEGKNLDLGVLKLDPDREVLDAASVSAVGNPIIIKKDTVEYNASSFSVTENDVLEDLLKKLPGVEVDSDGSITANGESITKIYIDGKEYFADDPTLASKNLPAKIVNKLKVVRKKSDQAEFTGIDDGEEETVLDLSIKPGMMNGLMGNIRGGFGHDIPADDAGYDEYRYTGNVFLGNFSTGTQYSIIGNINNGNNVGFGGFGGEMMRGMGGGGTSSNGGVTTSYMLGANVSRDFLDGDLETTGNYNYNGSESDVQSETYQEQEFDDLLRITDNKSSSLVNTDSHNIGMRIEHNFSKNSSLIFSPQISFGKGDSFTDQYFNSYDDVYADDHKINDGYSLNTSDKKSVSASGRLLYRQRLGIPGRTLILNSTFSFSDTDSDGLKQSITNTYEDGVYQDQTIVNQRTETDSKSSSVMARLTYTEPLGGNFYLEGNYSLTWQKSNSENASYDSGEISGFSVDNLAYNPDGELINTAYSNKVINESLTQRIGINFLYQSEKLRTQAGLSLNPSRTHNITNKADLVDETSYIWNAQIDTTYSVLNWSPQLRFDYEFSDNMNLRVIYRGSTSQPSVSQLVPVLDNSDPISQSLGNPYLNPYFSHNIRSELRYNNPQTYASFNINLSGGFTQDPIVNATWTDNGKTYTMPVNGPTSNNFSGNMFANMPIAKSNFSIFFVGGASHSKSASYIGSDVGTDEYFIYDDAGDATDFDYAKFRSDYPDMDNSSSFSRNDTKTTTLNGNLNVTYRNDVFELRFGGRTRYTNSSYSLNSENNKETFNNTLNGSVIYQWNLTGLSFKVDYNYKWYTGYTVDMPEESILNAEISKLIFRNRATISINAYDLLGQTSNYSSSESGTIRSESKNNTVGRYVLLSFAWRFGTFGGNSSRGNRGGGPGGFGGPRF